jgi:glutamate-1-semialdehyde 2,1-aminomutase
LTGAIKEAAEESEVPMYVSGTGSMFTTFFTNQEVTDYATAAASDLQLHASYFHQMLNRGVYIAPSQFEAGFLSLAHGDQEIAATIKACKESLSAIRSTK